MFNLLYLDLASHTIITEFHTDFVIGARAGVGVRTEEPTMVGKAGKEGEQVVVAGVDKTENEKK